MTSVRFPCCVGMGFVVLAFQAALAEEGIPSYPSGNREPIWTTITDEALERSPPWRAAEANPPVAARKVIALAEAKRPKWATDIPGDHGWKWRLRCLSLTPRENERWYWLVNYVAVPSDRGNAVEPCLFLAVLMNGTVVEPEPPPPRDRETEKGTEQKAMAADGSDAGKRFAAAGALPRETREKMIIKSGVIDKHFVVTVTEKAIQRAPPWQADEANPPIGARKAISLAQAKKSKLVADVPGPNGWTWELESATLVPYNQDRWFWRIDFRAQMPCGGLPPFLSLAVLMDGAIVEPEVLPGGIGEWGVMNP